MQVRACVPASVRAVCTVYVEEKRSTRSEQRDGKADEYGHERVERKEKERGSVCVRVRARSRENVR